jgi:transcriptional antiterminator RfaH
MQNWDVLTQRLEHEGFAAAVLVDKQRLFVQNKFVTVDTPLFPGYVFVNFDLADEAQNWRRIRRLPGIRTLLPQHSEIPVALPAGFVEELRQRKTRNAMGEVVRKFMPHDIVRAIAGPWIGTNAVVLSSNVTATWVRSVMGKMKMPTNDLARTA